jgi:HlyD family secretion protein
MRRPATLLLVLIALAAAGAGYWWSRQRAASAVPTWQGYVEAEYVRVSPTLDGRLVSLAVARGDQVTAGQPLFAQDETDDAAARDAAKGKLAEAEARLANLMLPGRQTEIEQAAADLADAQASRARIAKDLARNEELLKSGGVARQTVDQQRADLASADAKVAAAAAKLAQMRDPTGRQNEIAAQRAVLAQARAELAQAEWRLSQRRVAAPAAGLVADTYARPGETIAAGAAVVELLPPENVKVRFFVSETALGALRPGERMAIGCDGCRPDLSARVSFIAPQSEYTPPVIYSESNREKLVYLIEARPDPAQAALLHPGQPVDIRAAEAKQASR